MSDGYPDGQKYNEKVGMLKKPKMRHRIYLVLGALFVNTFAGSMVAVWYSLRAETLMTSVMEENVETLQIVEALVVELAKQKGFVSYYFLDGDLEWLRKLDTHRQVFQNTLLKVRKLAADAEQKKTLALIEKEYRRYTSERDAVIELYKSGNKDAGAILHRNVRNGFFTILAQCENYKKINVSRVHQLKKRGLAESMRLRIIAGCVIVISLFLAVLLAIILVRDILLPIRKLIILLNRHSLPPPSENDMVELSRSVYELIADMDNTQSKLEKSRETLIQSEKMAMVGKLAAGMAHSIRNPFTSVKMRLFTLNRSLELSEEQKEDFDVISEEIRHVDTIVQNFLEFSRPPKLMLQSVSPSTVVDMTLQLLKHRLRSYEVDVAVQRDTTLPDIEADPEQLKEVMVNLIVNACEAMRGKGEITILEAVSTERNSKQNVIIRISDSGPGIPVATQGKIFDHFFTTKEEGTGLGLCIAKRIIAEHKGELSMYSEEGTGTFFTITIPIKEPIRECSSCN